MFIRVQKINLSRSLRRERIFISFSPAFILLAFRVFSSASSPRLVLSPGVSTAQSRELDFGPGCRGKVKDPFGPRLGTRTPDLTTVTCREVRSFRFTGTGRHCRATDFAETSRSVYSNGELSETERGHPTPRKSRRNRWFAGAVLPARGKMSGRGGWKRKMPRVP